MSLLLRGYRAISSGVAPLAPWLLPRSSQPAEPVQSAGAFDLLVHGSSAGEIAAGLSWRSTLPLHRQPLKLVFSTGTSAGLRSGGDLLRPWDSPGAVSRFFDRVRPTALILVEADLWPCLLLEAQRRGIPIGVIGARMTARAASAWRLTGSAGRTVLGSVQAWACADASSLERLHSLGVDRDALLQTGWLKWSSDQESKSQGRAASQEEGRFVLGNLHPGELQLVLRKLGEGPLSPHRRPWLLVLRHSSAEPAVRREAKRLLPEGSYTIDARFGVLEEHYAAAGAIFVGGGGRGRGVHDLLAPLRAGCRPLCFLERGDPGDIGRILTEDGWVLPLDGLSSEDAQAFALTALQPPPASWDDLKAQYDGREAATRFLVERGVLPGWLLAANARQPRVMRDKVQ